MSELPDRANAVVVGGGIMGLATAYEMARLGFERIVVLERDYLCGGASGRNGGGVRAQWSSGLNIRLMKESIRICREFATKMRINVWFRQGGYLILARNEDRTKQLQASVELQAAHGLRARMIDAKEARELVPELVTDAVVAASYSPDDGVVFPWPFVWGYARACEQLGVGVFTHTNVSAIETRGRAISGVATPKGRIATSLVINATGAWSPELTSKLGVALPSRPHRHEICSTEPLKPFLTPLIADLETGLYCSQSMRGEIVGGISNEHVPPGLDQRSSLEFLGLYSSALLDLLPILGAVRILRQWAGCYDLTPDGSPVVGRVDEIDGLVLLCGFVGHGFMMAPIMARLTAAHLVKNEHQEIFDLWNLRRFREGRLLHETMILG